MQEGERAAEAPAVRIVVDGPPAPAWQAEAVTRVHRSTQTGSVGVRYVASSGAASGRLGRRLDRRLVRLARDPLGDAAVDVPVGVEHAAVTLWLASAEPGDLPGCLIVLRYGVHGEDVDSAHRRAFEKGSPVVQVRAHLVRDGADTGVLAHGTSAVRPFSLEAGVDAALWRSAVVAARAVDRFVTGVDARPVDRGTPAMKPPGRLIGRQAVRWARMLLIRLLFRRPWTIRCRERGSEASWETTLPGLAWLEGHTYADPFLFEHEGRHHLFCEHVRPGTAKGVISHVELGVDDPTEARHPVPVLEADHHLSYPFVFSHGGEVYLIPETAESRQIKLYRAVAFPHRWELDRVLVDDIVAVDTTLVEAEGRWWMFTSPGPTGATLGEELHLFFCDSPFGPWQPHPANPVVEDIRGGRSAGALFWRGGQLVRPAQDGSRRYGWAVSLREVRTLTERSYEEREVERIEPKDVPGARAVHTYACDGRYEAIDLRRRERRWSSIGRRP